MFQAPDTLIVPGLVTLPAVTLLKVPVQFCVPLFWNVPPFVTVVLFVKIPPLVTVPELMKLLPVALVKTPPPSIRKVAPKRTSTVLLLLKGVGLLKVPAKATKAPSFVNVACCVNVAELFTIPEAEFVKAELELIEPELFKVPEFANPPELMSEAPALTVKVPVLVIEPPLEIVLPKVKVDELEMLPKLSILKEILRGALITTEPPPVIVASFPVAGKPFDQLAAVNQSPFAGPVNMV